MSIPYILFWTIFSIVVGILYYRFFITYRIRTGQALSRALGAFKAQLIRVRQAVRELLKVKVHFPSIHNKYAAATNAHPEPEPQPDQRIPFGNLIRGIANPWFFKSGSANHWGMLLEWVIIAIWSLWIGRAYLDMGLNMWPSGGQEYIMSMQNQYMWTILPKCGACFFWNGFTNGGAPAFVDVLSGWLHPISIIATFLFGVFNSGKVIVLASFFMAGIGQWWLGKIMKLGTVPRVWAALIIVASGALTGRMEIGSPPLIQSIAACFLVFPAVLQVALYGGRKATIALGIVLGLAAVSGQGYIQAGLLFCLPPMVIVLLVGTHDNGAMRIKPQWRQFLFAIVLGGLIAGPLLVPLIHDSGMLGKDTDPTFSMAQPLEFNALNLVINNVGFYENGDLGKTTFPHLNINYVGWVPVILAIMGIAMAPRKLRKTIIAISVTIGFVYLTSSATLLKWISLLPFGGFAAGMRGVGQIQSLAAPLVLGLAGIGLDEFLKKDWPWVEFAVNKESQRPTRLQINAKWITLIILIIALQSVADFSQAWVYVAEVDQDTKSALQVLKTPNAQWVQPPFGDFIWLPAAIENGMKIAVFVRPWRLENVAELPAPYLQMSIIKDDAKLPEYLKTDGDYIILKRPDNLYASISDGQAKYACSASSIGGFIDVACDNARPGTLTVLEYALSGWTAWQDGQPVSLLSNSWLSVSAPAGKHQYAFRYQPWDAPLGIGLAMLGWIAAIAGLFYYSIEERRQPEDHNLNDIQAGW